VGRPAGVERLAEVNGLGRVIVPVRPTLKTRYPLIPIETFATWTRDDGSPLDPWVRTHTKIGASILTTAPESQTMTGSTDEWERWTGMRFPSPGRYVIPGGLSVLTIEDGTGVYIEPNIWLQHPLPG
jgi:hypothetical protein